MKSQQMQTHLQGGGTINALAGMSHSRLRGDIPQQQMVQEFEQNEQHRTHLAEAAYAYMNTRTDFIADIVAPIYPVTALAGKYRKYDERTFYDRPVVNTGKDTPPKKIDQGSQFENYDLSGRSLAAYLSDVDKDDAIHQYGSVERWREVITMQLTHLLLLDRELTVATLLLGFNVRQQLRKAPQVTGATTVDGPAVNQLRPRVSDEGISNYFDTPIIYGRARYNSTPSSATPTFTYIWANYAVVMHNAVDIGNPELATPFVRTFKLQSTTFPNVGGFTVKSVRDESTIAGGEILMVGYFCEEKIFAQKAGYLIEALS